MLKLDQKIRSLLIIGLGSEIHRVTKGNYLYPYWGVNGCLRHPNGALRAAFGEF